MIPYSSIATLLQEFRNQTGPARLVTGADAGAVIAVEVFVEGNEIAPIRIRLKFLDAAKHRPTLRR